MIHLNFRTQPLHFILADMAHRHPKLPCLDFLGRKMTYGEVWESVERTARGLQDIGVVKGTRVGLCMPNTPYYVIGYFAILLAGGTVVNFNPLYTEEEIFEQLDDSGVEVVFTTDLKKNYAKIAPLLRTTPLRAIVVCSLADALPPIKGLMFLVFKHTETAHPPVDLAHIPIKLLQAENAAPDPVEIDPTHDIAVIQYTGGTTGLAKGAMLTHRNLCANIEQIRLWLGDTEPGAEKVLCVIPFFHVFAMTVAMNLGLTIGAELILLPRFDLDQVLHSIADKRPTLFPAVPTIYGAIAHHDRVKRFDLTSLRYCISGGAPLPVETKRDFEAASKCVVVEGFGLTEASPVVTCNPPRGICKTGSIGLPLPGTQVEIRDLDNHRKTLGVGKRGELFVRGPQVMAGYWRRPEESADVLESGWLRTGDIGHMDEDGYIFITDRLKHVINCSGFKVYPRVIEEALHRHPAVREAVAIGIPDNYRGEAPKAFVTLKPNIITDEAALLAFCHEHLNPIEYPVAIEIRDELPKTLIGKLSKKELIAEHRERLLQAEEHRHG
jgi:long-chain acyl-CoA synthetase